MKKKMSKSFKIFIINLLISFAIVLLLQACTKSDDSKSYPPPTCVVNLPDTLESGVPFEVDASRSYSQSPYLLDTMCVTYTMGGRVDYYAAGLVNTFVTDRKGKQYMWVQVYEAERGHSDRKVFTVYFK